MSTHEKFRGTGIAIVTPFTDDGVIDWESFQKLINFWIEGDVEYLVVLGTTGESPTIHGEEKQKVFSFVNDVSAALAFPLWQASGAMTQMMCWTALRILI